MSSLKRKSSESDTSSKKKSKYDLDKYDKLAEDEDLSNRIKSDLDKMNSVEPDNVLSALNYLKSIFCTSFDPLPQVMFHHQLYSLIKNKTKVDREIELLKTKNIIHVFKSESNKTNEDDLSICFTDDFNSYVQQMLIAGVENVLKLTNNYNEERLKSLINRFIDKILGEVKELSISQKDLKLKYKLSEAEITALVQTGLLNIKDMSSYWFAIPFVGKFRKALVDSRKAIISVLKRKKFNELFIEEIYKRNIKIVNQIGIMYLICDLIGKEAITRVDSPIGFVVKLSQ